MKLLLNATGVLGMSVVVALITIACAKSGSGDHKSSGLSLSSGSTQVDDELVFANRIIAYLPIDSGWASSLDVNTILGAPGGPGDSVWLGYDPTQAASLGGSIVLGFGSDTTPHCIVDGSGPDVIVYSSTIPWTDGIPGTNNQVMTVEVSNDGNTWFPFPTATDPSKAFVDPLRYPKGLAGVTPTIGTGANAQGGDAFDLSDISSLPVDLEVCYMRITDAGTLIPDYGNSRPDLDPEFMGGGVDAVKVLNSTVKEDLVP